MTDGQRRERTRGGRHTPERHADERPSSDRPTAGGGALVIGVPRVERASLGLWSAFAPRSSFDGLPGPGNHWVGLKGPYSQFHLGHRSQLPTGDQMASLVGLALQVVLGSLCLVAAPPSAIVPAVFRPLARHGHLVVDHPDQAVDAAGHRPRLVDVLRPSQRGMADSTCRKNQRPLSPLGRVDPPNQLNGVSWPRSIQQS
jgi:hypothetical protein